MDPIELARRVAMDFFQAGQYLAAALVYGECLKRKPDDAGLLLGFGAAVGNSAGGLVVAPFVQWSTRILTRCIAVDPGGRFSEVARERLVELAKKAEYLSLPPIDVEDLEPLLEFLDVSPGAIMADAVATLPDDERMGAMMGLGELGCPRFASAMARAISGVWGVRPANAAMKRIRPYAGHRIVRDALVTLRARSDAEEFEPYLQFAERGVAPVPITVETPEGFVKVRPPDVGPPASDDHAN
ncbi:MAG: hypothetical protein ACKV2T_02060 [Kofleriaceae bacterium]